MRIGGLQKLTLLDFPGQMACTVFLPGCNLRCPFCHNADLVLRGKELPTMSEDEFFSFLKSRQGILEGVCVTGGEPMLHPELPDFLKKIRDHGFLVKLDTNGTRPEVLRKLLTDGLLDYVAMDIKNSPDRYTETCGGAEVLDEVRRSAALLMESGLDYEFRTTVCKPLHTPEDLQAIGRWLTGARKYFLQQFVQSDHLIGGGMTPPTEEEMKALLHAVQPYIPNTRLRGVSA